MIRNETDINFKDRLIFLPADNTKGKKDRYVFFSVQMATELRRWLNYRDRYKDSEFCFCTIKGSNLLVRSFESNFSNPIFQIPNGITKARVYVWIEGQDIDALEVHSEGAPVALNLDLEKDLAGYEGL